MRRLRETTVEFPGYSKGHYITKCGIRLLMIDGVTEPILGSWIVRPLVPSIGVFLALFGWTVGSYAIFSQFNRPISFFLTVLDLILMALFLVAFIRTIVTGPGYFPFYWSIGAANLTHDDSSEMTPLFGGDDVPAEGIISSKEQLEWARGQPRPPRCIVARLAKRIVIRPDHYCSWSETWIGKRNQKFFTLYNLYGTLFIGLIALCAGIQIGMQVIRKSWEMNVMSVVIGFMAFIASYFAMFTGSFLFASLFLIATGRSNWEQANKFPREMFDQGYRKNMEDVCGSADKWWTWLSPFHSPFKGVSNEKLVEGYPNYYEV